MSATITNAIQKIRSSISSISTKTMTAILVGVLFLIAALLYYRYYVTPTLNPTYKANREVLDNDSASGKTAELLFFYTDWCPHCKTAKPVWQEMKAEYQDKRINGYKVVFTDVNCTNESNEVEQMMDKYKIEGYPTIKLLKDGQIIEYDAKPTKETLTQFLNTVL
jgi:thiol-disulfide isomerase/thioredoxin